MISDRLGFYEKLWTAVLALLFILLVEDIEVNAGCSIWYFDALCTKSLDDVAKDVAVTVVQISDSLFRPTFAALKEIFPNVEVGETQFYVLCLFSSLVRHHDKYSNHQRSC